MAHGPAGWACGREPASGCPFRTAWARRAARDLRGNPDRTAPSRQGRIATSRRCHAPERPRAGPDREPRGRGPRLHPGVQRVSSHVHGLLRGRSRRHSSRRVFGSRMASGWGAVPAASARERRRSGTVRSRPNLTGSSPRGRVHTGVSSIQARMYLFQPPHVPKVGGGRARGSWPGRPIFPGRGLTHAARGTTALEDARRPASDAPVTSSRSGRRAWR
jgi:hypothetical protein